MQHPVANRPAKNDQVHDENRREDCGAQQKQRPHVPADRTQLVRIPVDHPKPFHQQLHHLRSRQKRSAQSQQNPLPGSCAVLGQENY